MLHFNHHINFDCGNNKRKYCPLQQFLALLFVLVGILEFNVLFYSNGTYILTGWNFLKNSLGEEALESLSIKPWTMN